MPREASLWVKASRSKNGVFWVGFLGPNMKERPVLVTLDV